jgi:hypothetical protein
LLALIGVEMGNFWGTWWLLLVLIGVYLQAHLRELVAHLSFILLIKTSDLFKLQKNQLQELFQYAPEADLQSLEKCAYFYINVH